MKSVLSSAGLFLSRNSFYSAVINPLGFYYHGGMKSAPSSALPLSKSPSFRGQTILVFCYRCGLRCGWGWTWEEGRGKMGAR